MSAAMSMRERLRAATSAPHQRLHLHAGLAAAAVGTIDLGDYRLLLMRLYGFHRAFEDALAGAPLERRGAARSLLLAQDMASLGIGDARRGTLRLCRSLRRPASDAAALGALYVVEGSALGGRQIARALEPTVGDARRFFLGDPAARTTWPTLLTQIDGHAADAQGARELIDAALGAFAQFEDWMRDWRSVPFVTPDHARIETRV